MMSEPQAIGSAEIQALTRALEGEYDNYQQVLAQRRALREGRRTARAHQRVHTLIERVEAPQIGRDVLFMEQTLNDDPDRVLRRQIHRFVDHPQRDAVKHLVFDFQQPDRFSQLSRNRQQFLDLTLADLVPRPGCEVFWRDVNDYMHGTTEPQRCVRSAPDGRELIVDQDLRLYGDTLWILDRATDGRGLAAYGPPDDMHQKSRRAVRFQGWAGVRPAARAAGAVEAPWQIQRDLSLHSEGGTVVLTDDEGRPTGYSLRLERLTGEAAPIPMLRLSLLDDQRSRVVGYAWTADSGEVVGLNLGWAQAEMRRAQ